MGLLTDPSAGQGKLVKTLIEQHSKLCCVMYVGAVVWFCLLAHPPVNMPTYFSENALLPGLVKSEFQEGNAAKSYYHELLDEMETYKDSIPYPWLLAKLRQIGLDTYSHNFTLNYPLGKMQTFTGKNVYGILRAPRAASIESLVFSVPYRPPSSAHLTTAPAVALMLAFAKFANRDKYWAKDIIFLITEHEQLGVQAWLEAYHSTSCGSKGTLEHGDLRGRAGAIQAAINLELHDINIARTDIKIEGLNGHLPNLDLFSLVNRMCAKEGVQTTFKNRVTYHTEDQYQEWQYSFRTMLSMIATQSTGVPNGNHGLFHRFGIESVTLEGFGRVRDKGNSVDFFTIGRILEGLFRSLNNLLERFHQSYFFYLLPSSDRFVSIGYYIPVIICLAGTLFVKSCANWYQLRGDTLLIRNKKANDDNKVGHSNSNMKSYNLVRVSVIILVTHAIGVCVMNSPYYLAKFGYGFGYATNTSVYFGFIFVCLLLLLLPAIVPGNSTARSMRMLNIITNLEMGTVLIAIGMMNFSLALLLGLFYVPIMLFLVPVNNRLLLCLFSFLWILVHPFVFMTIIILVSTYFTFPDEEIMSVFFGGIGASQQALMFSIVDSFIYGNWLFKVATAVILPNWLNLWVALFPQTTTDKVVTATVSKKVN